VQNLARFRTTSKKFDSEYLRNGWRYSKSVKYLIDHDSFGVRRKKFRELWITNSRDLDVKSYQPKSTFSEDYISAPKGCCTPKFSHALENDKVLLAHPHRNGSPPYNFFKGGSKIGLNFTKCTPITLGVVGVAPRYFATWRAFRLGDNTGTTLLGHHPLKILEGKKRPKFDEM